MDYDTWLAQAIQEFKEKYSVWADADVYCISESGKHAYVRGEFHALSCEVTPYPWE